jgi:hypothetical protein
MRRLAAALTALLLAARPAAAYELQERNAALWLGVLAPGRTADIGKAASAPMLIVNTGGEPITVTISVRRPAEDDEWMKRKGFEPVPDASWIRLPGEVVVPPNASVPLTGTVRVPPKAEWRGRRFQFDVVFASKGAGTIAIALRGAGRFEVGRR